MRGMAGLASLAFYWLVLIDKRPALVAMALEANHVLVRRRAKLPVSRRPVGIVAVIALDQPLFHTMMKWLLEIGSLFDVAREAKWCLLLYQLIFKF